MYILSCRANSEYLFFQDICDNTALKTAQLVITSQSHVRDLDNSVCYLIPHWKLFSDYITYWPSHDFAQDRYEVK